MPHRAEIRPLLLEAAELAISIGPSGLRTKSDGSLVTRADVEVGDLLTERCRALLPRADVVQEESAHRTTGGTFWAIDPIDGTTNFARGDARWCISVALIDDGSTVLGGIAQPATGRMWLADTTGSNLETATTTTRAWAITGHLPANLRRLSRLPRWAGRGATRITGSAALDLVDVAEGRFERVVGFGLSLWDVAAGGLFVRTMGGSFETRDVGGGKLDMVATRG